MILVNLHTQFFLQKKKKKKHIQFNSHIFFTTCSNNKTLDIKVIFTFDLVKMDYFAYVCLTIYMLQNDKFNYLIIRQNFPITHYISLKVKIITCII